MSTTEAVDINQFAINTAKGLIMDTVRDANSGHTGGPFSSLDYNTARKIFKNCIKPLSRSKTVLLVTHELNYLEQSN